MAASVTRRAAFVLAVCSALALCTSGQIVKGSCKDSVRPSCICDGTCTRACGLLPGCLCAGSAACTSGEFRQHGRLWALQGEDPPSRFCRLAQEQDTAAMRDAGIKARLLMLGDSVLESALGSMTCRNVTSNPDYAPDTLLPVMNEARARYCPMKVHAVGAANTSRLMHALTTGERDTGLIVQPGGAIALVNVWAEDVFFPLGRAVDVTPEGVGARVAQIAQHLISMTRGQAMVAFITGIPRCTLPENPQPSGRCDPQERVSDKCWTHNTAVKANLLRVEQLIEEWVGWMTSDACLAWSVRPQGQAQVCYKGRMKVCNCAAELLHPDGSMDKTRMPDCVHPNAQGWKAMWDGCLKRCFEGLTPDPVYAGCCPSPDSPASWQNPFSCAANAAPPTTSNPTPAYPSTPMAPGVSEEWWRAMTLSSNPYCVQQGHPQSTFTACTPGVFHQFCPGGVWCTP